MKEHRITQITEKDFQDIINNSVQNTKVRLVGNPAEVQKAYVKPIANLDKTPNVLALLQRMAKETEDAVQEIPLVPNRPIYVGKTYKKIREDIGKNNIDIWTSTNHSYAFSHTDFNRSAVEGDKFGGICASFDGYVFNISAEVVKVSEDFVYFKIIDKNPQEVGDFVLLHIPSEIPILCETTFEFNDKNYNYLFGKFKDGAEVEINGTNLVMFNRLPQTDDTFFGIGVTSDKRNVGFTAIIKKITYANGIANLVVNFLDFVLLGEDSPILLRTITFNGVTAETFTKTDSNGNYLFKGYESYHSINTEFFSIPPRVGNHFFATAVLKEDANDDFSVVATFTAVVTGITNGKVDYSVVDATIIHDPTKIDDQITKRLAEVVAGADESYDTLKEIADWIKSHPESVAQINTAIRENANQISIVKSKVSQNIEEISKKVDAEDIKYDKEAESLHVGAYKAPEKAEPIATVVDTPVTNGILGSGDLTSILSEGDTIYVGLLYTPFTVSRISIAGEKTRIVVSETAQGVVRQGDAIYKSKPSVISEVNGCEVKDNEVRERVKNDCVMKTDYPIPGANGKAGVINIDTYYGFNIGQAGSAGALLPIWADNNAIDSQSEHRFINPKNFYYAFMKALTDGIIILTDEQKAQALALLGAVEQNTKRQTWLAGQSTLYGSSYDSNGVPTDVLHYVTAYPLSGRIPRWTGRTTLETETPSEPKDCTNKDYVDNLPDYLELTEEQKAKWRAWLGIE